MDGLINKINNYSKSSNLNILHRFIKSLAIVKSGSGSGFPARPDPNPAIFGVRFSGLKPDPKPYRNRRHCLVVPYPLPTVFSHRY